MPVDPTLMQNYMSGTYANIDWDAVANAYGEATALRLRKLVEQGAQGLGMNGRMLLGQLGEAVGAPDVFSQNDIRNAGLAQRAVAGQTWRDTGEQMASEAGLGGLVDSGGYYEQRQRARADIDTQGQQGAAGVMGQMMQGNQQTRLARLSGALGNLQNWANIRKSRRLSQAALQGQLAYGSALNGGLNGASGWGAASGLLGAAGTMMGAFGMGSTQH